MRVKRSASRRGGEWRYGDVRGGVAFQTGEERAGQGVELAVTQSMGVVWGALQRHVTARVLYTLPPAECRQSQLGPSGSQAPGGAAALAAVRIALFNSCSLSFPVNGWAGQGQPGQLLCFHIRSGVSPRLVRVPSPVRARGARRCSVAGERAEVAESRGAKGNRKQHGIGNIRMIF